MDQRIREGIEPIEPRAGDGLSSQPVAALMRELAQEGQHLVREEVRLAKLELREEAQRLGKGAGAMGAAAVVGHVALLCFATMLILALAGGMKAWVAATVVMVLFAGAAAGLFFWGKSRLENLKPEQTLRTLEEDRRWMKETVQRVKSRSHASA
jgi:uncharacterized membrane protein YqjE